MLVLNREAGEAFSIGDEINLQVLAVHGNQVRLGITAPRQVKIHRAEVYRRIVQRRLEPAGLEEDHPE
ncbi:carbon storage regulator CsrA [Pseudomonas syringae]|uniref:Translational regulator CsrA n=1 Tax=Pseudomonas syringae TaxID=317 RepID=A0A085VEV5_PSESX|nr:carbon storage regulator CsrA [Pseudomonas syringae]KFE53968.1 carbon storage regulator [Pseudomonas syringae]